MSTYDQPTGRTNEPPPIASDGEKLSREARRAAAVRACLADDRQGFAIGSQETRRIGDDMKTNLERCLNNALAGNRWLAAELTSNLRELRDRSRAGGMVQALHEFFNLYRFDDNEQEPDGFWGGGRPQAAEPAKTDLEQEKLRRIYYQNIAYHAASVLDQIERRDITKGEGLLTGTADEPSDDVVLALDRLLHRIRQAEAPRDPGP